MKKAAQYFWLILFLSALAVSCKSPDANLLSRFLPLNVNGWTVLGEDQYYNPFTIANYIDRAGDVYVAYDFRQLLVRLYSKEGQPKIHADFFDMGSARNAFGIFSFNPEGEEAGIGQGSTHKGSLLVFWKDRYFVSLYSEHETEEAKKTILDIGREMASAIAKDGEIPSLVSRLPQDGLIPRSTHFFFNHLILNYFSFFSGEDILELGEGASAVLGRYGSREEAYSLLLVEYSDVPKASAARVIFRDKYLPPGFEPDIFETEAGKWMGIKTSEELLMILWNAPSQTAAEELLSKVK